MKGDEYGTMQAVLDSKNGDAEASEEATTLTAPRVLLADTSRWDCAVRMGIALAGAGCEVYALCPASRHPFTKVRAVKKIFSYSGVRPVDSLAAAIEAVDPQIVIPCSDPAVAHLHELYLRSENARESAARTRALIERSLGAPISYPVVTSRHDLLKVAAEDGILVPQMRSIEKVGDFVSCSEFAFPWVIKADGTWGGGGVRIARNLAEAKTSFAVLKGIFGAGRAFKRLAVNRDSFWLRAWWSGAMPSLMLQSYIPGKPANCAVACWEGEVLAGLAVEVLTADGETGPASVVRVVESVAMMSAAEKIARRLGLSGVFGLDFVIEERTGEAYLIEMNPRCTPLCHLRMGAGHDMVEALRAQLTGQPLRETSPLTENRVIAYYPQGRKSELLSSSFLDVPREEPELVQELLNPWPDRSLLFRMSNYLSRVRQGKTASANPTA